MTRRISIGILVTWAAALLAGCGSIDTTPEGNPDRVLRGAVNYTGILPAGTEVTVRLLEPARPESLTVGATDLPVPAAAKADRGERVVAETTKVLAAATREPVAFELGYLAEDAVLRRGLTVDVRVAIGGRVRMRTVNAHVVTLAASPFKQEVWVQNVQ